LSDETQRRLHDILPTYLTVANPIDNGGTFVMRHPADVRQRVLDIVMEDPAVDVLLVGVTGAMGVLSDPLCEDLRDMAVRGTATPVVVTWNSPKTDERGYELLIESQLPLFRSFRNCFAALARTNEWRDASARMRVRTSPSTAVPGAVKSALVDAKSGVLDAERTRSLLTAYKVPLARESTALSAAAAVAIAGDFGYPVVMKLASPDFPHKSDAGLVRLGIEDSDAAKAAYVELVDRGRKIAATAQIDGVLVQEMITDGVEMIVGVTRDPVLGHAVLVGMGGIFTEVYADTAVRPLPVDEYDVWEMLRSLRGFPLLDGARGRPKLDTRALVRTVLAVAQLTAGLGDRLAELDLNPVLVRTKGACRRRRACRPPAPSQHGEDQPFARRAARQASQWSGPRVSTVTSSST
jgi:acyl-CoA synthetase (NDP forming)